MKTLRVDYSNLFIANLVTKGIYTTIFKKKVQDIIVICVLVGNADPG